MSANIEFITANNIDFVCHDDVPYGTAGVSDSYGNCKKVGKFKATQRTKGISTTDIVAEILKNKDIYYARNLRRGLTRQELGLSFIYYLKIRLDMLLCPERLERPKH